MTEYHKELGRVRSVWLGIEDHGILSFNIDLEFGSSVQGTGHYAIGNETGGPLVKAYLDFFQVREVGDIKGAEVFALRDHPHDVILGFEQPAYRGGKRFIIKNVISNLQGL